MMTKANLKNKVAPCSSSSFNRARIMSDYFKFNSIRRMSDQVQTHTHNLPYDTLRDEIFIFLIAPNSIINIKCA